MSNPVCPKTGAQMHRDVRPMTLTYKSESITIDMPGWYCDSSDESIHTGQDAVVSDRALNRLKARHEGLLEPEEIRRIRKKLGLKPDGGGQDDRRRTARVPEVREGRPSAKQGDQQRPQAARSRPKGLRVLKLPQDKTAA